MTANGPLISIILPTYNVEKYIDRCLASCASQTLSNIEIIIVDDCGSDNSLGRAQVWIEKDERIKIISNPRNLGTYHARRIGVEHASAEYIIFLDPDDELRLDAAEVIYQATKNFKPELIFFKYQEIPKNKWWPAKQNLPPSVVQGDKLPQDVLVPSMSFGTSGKAYSRETLLRSYRALNISTTKRMTYAEDALLLYAVLVEAKQSTSIDQPLYLYHINPGSAMTKKDPRSLHYNAEQIDIVISILQQHPLKHCSEVRKRAARAACHTITNKLLLDKLFMLRHTLNADGKSQYLRNLLRIIFCFQRWKESVRLIAFFCTCGIIRL